MIAFRASASLAAAEKRGSEGLAAPLVVRRPLPGLTEIRDAGGNHLGYFSPSSHQLPEAYAQAAAHFDPQEMKGRKTSGQQRRTTAEVLNRIASQP